MPSAVVAAGKKGIWIAWDVHEGETDQSVVELRRFDNQLNPTSALLTFEEGMIEHIVALDDGGAVVAMSEPQEFALIHVSPTGQSTKFAVLDSEVFLSPQIDTVAGDILVTKHSSDAYGWPKILALRISLDGSTTRIPIRDCPGDYSSSLHVTGDAIVHICSDSEHFSDQPKLVSFSPFQEFHEVIFENQDQCIEARPGTTIYWKGGETRLGHPSFTGRVKLQLKRGSDGQTDHLRRYQCQRQHLVNVPYQHEIRFKPGKRLLLCGGVIESLRPPRLPKAPRAE